MRCRCEHDISAHEILETSMRARAQGVPYVQWERCRECVGTRARNHEFAEEPAP